ncbi:MAG: hypothetical protein ACR2PR_11210 [Pseudohongiellaceae bacterium]
MREVQSLSFGGGVQSNAILVLVAQGKLPPPDVVIIADTGYETKATWNYLSKYGEPLCHKLGIPFMRVSRAGSNLDPKYNSAIIDDELGANILIPAFIQHNDGVSKARTFCSDIWKRAVVRHNLRLRYPQAKKIVEWIGFSVDEIARAQRRKIALHDEKWHSRYPLLELKISRYRAAEIVREYGWDTPPRSACWMCPNNNNARWRHIRDNYPDEFAKAVKFEKWLQDRAESTDHEYKPYLHRSAIPINAAPIDDDKQGDFGFCDNGCFT